MVMQGQAGVYCLSMQGAQQPFSPNLLRKHHYPQAWEPQQRNSLKVHDQPPAIEAHAILAGKGCLLHFQSAIGVLRIFRFELTW